jgi:hypothetical protein
MQIRNRFFVILFGIMGCLWYLIGTIKSFFVNPCDYVDILPIILLCQIQGLLWVILAAMMFKNDILSPTKVGSFQKR